MRHCSLSEIRNKVREYSIAFDKIDFSILEEERDLTKSQIENMRSQKEPGQTANAVNTGKEIFVLGQSQNERLAERLEKKKMELGL